MYEKNKSTNFAELCNNISSEYVFTYYIEKLKNKI